MLREQTTLRNFKGGSWDLRKDERRKQALIIGFPDRRSKHRRVSDHQDDRTNGETLLWSAKPLLDE